MRRHCVDDAQDSEYINLMCSNKTRKPFPGLSFVLLPSLSYFHSLDRMRSSQYLLSMTFNELPAPPFGTSTYALLPGINLLLQYQLSSPVFLEVP